ncbi:MAG: hypothetical protein JSV86_16820 [Gemmatimonadota bacterium]|nr:MAG: hypothetical protein JSV86_16820 [Gemmatimonadota bacterium]
MATTPSKFQSNEFDLPRMTADEIADFVRRYCDGQIITANDVLHRADPSNPESANARRAVFTTFMPLALGALETWSDERMQQIGTIWEELSKAAPRMINGLPCFFSMRLMHIDDWKTVADLIDAELRRRDEDA